MEWNQDIAGERALNSNRELFIVGREQEPIFGQAQLTTGKRLSEIRPQELVGDRDGLAQANLGLVSLRQPGIDRGNRSRTDNDGGAAAEQAQDRDGPNGFHR